MIGDMSRHFPCADPSRLGHRDVHGLVSICRNGLSLRSQDVALNRLFSQFDHTREMNPNYPLVNRRL
ncbi:hypothetical protein VTO58DRAFT_103630 [Aureobasidium pullulans]